MMGCSAGPLWVDGGETYQRPSVPKLFTTQSSFSQSTALRQPPREYPSSVECLLLRSRERPLPLVSIRTTRRRSQSSDSPTTDRADFAVQTPEIATRQLDRSLTINSRTRDKSCDKPTEFPMPLGMSRSAEWTPIRLSIALSMLMIAKASSPGEVNTRMPCDQANLKCAYRTGCGSALQSYLVQCASVHQGDSTECPESCQHALIALTSTDEGKDLMMCDCAPDDAMCNVSRQRVEICRSSVMLAMNTTRSSCRVATWICNADSECSTALYWYNIYCRSMFIGKKCTHRCKNSISILRRQEKAQKLNSCICDGEEEFECRKIHRNMNLLCHKKSKLDPVDPKNSGDVQTNEVQKDSSNLDNKGLRLQADKILSLAMILLMIFITKD